MVDRHLVCAYCAVPVTQGRCASCRQARATLHADAVRRALVLAVGLLIALIAGIAVSAARGTA